MKKRSFGGRQALSKVKTVCNLCPGEPLCYHCFAPFVVEYNDWRKVCVSHFCTGLHCSPQDPPVRSQGPLEDLFLWVYVLSRQACSKFKGHPCLLVPLLSTFANIHRACLIIVTHANISNWVQFSRYLKAQYRLRALSSFPPKSSGHTHVGTGLPSSSLKTQLASILGLDVSMLTLCRAHVDRLE